MKRGLLLFSLFVLGVVIAAGTFSVGQVQAQFGPPSPERQAARAKQLTLEAVTPNLQITEGILPASVPGHTIGETEGISMNSKGHLFVYSRTGTGGSARGGTAAELFEFDENLKFVNLWGPGNYAASFAHSVRVDKYDNVWMLDEGSGMIVKFDPNGVVKMTLGRKLEATDLTWDAQDNIYVSDGYDNSRIVKIAKDGTWVKAVGTYGSGPNQFNTPHGIAADAQGNIYVADRGNDRIQVYDTDLNFKKSINGVGMPWT